MSICKVYNLSGEHLHTIDLPSKGIVNGFDGINDGIKLTKKKLLGTNYTAFIVAKTADDHGAFLSQYKIGAGGMSLAIYQNKLRHWMREKDTKIAEGDFGDDNPFVMIIKNANNNVDVFANGGVESGSGSVVVATPADAENIIGNQSSTTQPLDGEISEIIIFDSALDDQKIIDIQNYLSNKWNLTTTVDSDGDGFTDAVEQLKGSIPTDNKSIPMGIPSILGQAKLWLDASNIDGDNNNSLSDGDAVGEWKDLSRNGNHVVQANNSFSPTLNKFSDIGDKPGIEFSSDFLTLSSSNSFDNWSKYTKIVVYETNQVSTAQVIIDIHWKNSSDIDVGSNEIGINSGGSYFNARNVNRIASQAWFYNLQMNTPYIALAEDLDNNGSHLFHNGEESLN